MLKKISIENFQSLYNVSVDLAPFTVIVGPSSSGKSAFIRAIQLLVKNKRGLLFLSHGATTCKVVATTEDSQVIITRSTSLNSYEIQGIHSDDYRKFTKLAGNVPEAVSAALGIPTDSIGIAGQFDPPFLLTASPQQAQQTLASLTPAELVYSASKEANKRRLNASANVKQRQQDIDSISFDKFINLEERAEALNSARASYENLEKLTQSYNMLADLIIPTIPNRLYAEIPETQYLRELYQQYTELETLRSNLKPLPKRLISELPDIQLYKQLLSQHAELQELSRNFTENIAAFRLADAHIKDADQVIVELQEDYNKALAELEICPLCKQDIKEHSHDRFA